MVITYVKEHQSSMILKSLENHFHTFLVLSYKYTCGLELDIFFLGSDMITQNFSSHAYIVVHTNFVKVLQLSQPFLFVMSQVVLMDKAT